MNKALLSAAMAGILTVGLAAGAQAADSGAMTGKVKCYGIAKAGKNSCAAADKSHSCAGQSKVDNSLVDFTLVSDSATCTADKGALKPPMPAAPAAMAPTSK
jgi:uncharacterized membrane protein